MACTANEQGYHWGDIFGQWNTADDIIAAANGNLYGYMARTLDQLHEGNPDAGYDQYDHDDVERWVGQISSELLLIPDDIVMERMMNAVAVVLVDNENKEARQLARFWARAYLDRYNG